MTWIDFKELRRKLRMSDVLAHYRVELKIRGDRASGFCPLPTHQGKRRSPSFSVQLVRGCWQCFGCGAKGNAVDLACRLEGMNPEDPQEFREAALLIADRFQIDSDQEKPTKSQPKAASPYKEKKDEAIATPPIADTRPRVINPPLEFELKKLNANHSYLKDRGFTPETISYFGLGFCNRGMLSGRIGIPLRDSKDSLVGYAGRLVDDALVDEEHPKYLFPSEREQDGTVFEFRKSLFLYHGSKIQGPINDLIVVEGFPSTWWLWQNGFWNVVALMGSSSSAEQAELIVRLVSPEGRVWILPDADQAGTRFAHDVFFHVGPERFCRWVKLPEGEQPTDCTQEELQALLGTPLTKKERP